MNIARAAWVAVALTAAMLAPPAAGLGGADRPGEGTAGDEGAAEVSVRVLTMGLRGTSGSAIGPDGALYLTDRVAGSVIRVDIASGAASTFASGLPSESGSPGGAMDVVFLRRSLHVLVTNPRPESGRDRVSGIYRFDGADSWSVVADLGAYTQATSRKDGLYFALESTRDGFLVTDSRHHRVLAVTQKGQVSELAGFGRVVPTGITRFGRSVYVAQARPMSYGHHGGGIAVIHGRNSNEVTQIAWGDSRLVDVEFAGCDALFALSHGYTLAQVRSPEAGQTQFAALPSTGRLLRVRGNGALSLVAEGLDAPTSVEFAGGAALVVAGDTVFRIENAVTGVQSQHPGARCRHQF